MSDTNRQFLELHFGNKLSRLHFVEADAAAWTLRGLLAEYDHDQQFLKAACDGLVEHATSGVTWTHDSPESAAKRYGAEMFRAALIFKEFVYSAEQLHRLQRAKQYAYDIRAMFDAEDTLTFTEYDDEDGPSIEVYSKTAHLSEPDSWCHTFFGKGETWAEAWEDVVDYMRTLANCDDHCICRPLF